MTNFLEDIKRAPGLFHKIALKKRLDASDQAKLNQLKDAYGLDSQGGVPTQKEIAQLLGVSTRTVSRWIAEGMPVESNGTYNPIKIIHWREDLLDDSDDDVLISEKSKWDIEFRKFRAMLAELEFKKASSELIELSLVENLLVERALELKRSLLSRAKRLSALVANKPAEEAYQLIEEDVLDTLRAYSRPSPALEEAKKAAQTSTT